MPAPITAPMPSPTRFQGPSTGFSALCERVPTTIESIDFVAKSDMPPPAAQHPGSGTRSDPARDEPRRIRDGRPATRRSRLVAREPPLGVEVLGGRVVQEQRADHLDRD